jgi:hypothetical protein
VGQLLVALLEVGAGLAEVLEVALELTRVRLLLFVLKRN